MRRRPQPRSPRPRDAGGDALLDAPPLTFSALGEAADVKSQKALKKGAP